jgi:formate/nitrite transporter FocA (FNT family)
MAEICGLGALMHTLVARDADLGFATSRLLGGLIFSLGLVLVTVAMAEVHWCVCLRPQA